MTHAFPQIERDKPVTAAEIEDLRCAVGWDRFEDKYDRILPNSYSHFTVHDDDRLIGFLNIISDGIGNGFLLDLMVAPDFQGRGIGRALVQKAVEELTNDGVRCVQVTFTPELEGFYKRCGFHIFKGGIIDNAHRSNKPSDTPPNTTSTSAI